MEKKDNRRPHYWHSITGEEAARLLTVDPARGLTKEEATRRLRHLPDNALFRVKRMPLNGFTDFAAILLIVTAAASALFGRETEAAAIAILLLISAASRVVTDLLAIKVFSRAALADAPVGTVLREGKLFSLSADAIVPGDILFLYPGDTVPCDARILSGEGELLESALTGMQGCVLKNGNDIFPKDTPCAYRRNIVFANTNVVSGTFRALAVATGENTYAYARNGTVFIKGRETPSLLERLSGWSRNVALFMTALVLFVCFGAVFLGRGAWEIDTLFLSALALAVASMSEFLLSGASVIIAVSMHQFRATSSGNAVIKHAETIEKLSDADCILLSSEDMLLSDEICIGAWFSGGAFHEFTENDVCPPPLSQLLNTVSLCCGTSHMLTDLNRVSSDSPLLSLSRRLNERYHPSPRAIELRVLATDSTKLQTALVEENGELTAYVVASLQEILYCCSYIDKNGISLPIPRLLREELLAQDTAYQRRSIQTVAIARRPSPYNNLSRATALQSQMTLLGFFTVLSPLEATLVHLCDKARAGNLRLFLITEHPTRAQHLAAEAGILQNETDQTLSSLPALQTFLSAGTGNAVIDASAIGDREEIVRTVSAIEHGAVYVGSTVRDMKLFALSAVSAATESVHTRTPQCVKRRADIAVSAPYDGTSAPSPLLSILRAAGYAKNTRLHLRTAAEYLLFSQSVRLCLMLASVFFQMPLQTPLSLLLWGLLLDFAAVFALAFPSPSTSILARRRCELALPALRSGILFPCSVGAVAALLSALLPNIIQYNLGIILSEEIMRCFLYMSGILATSAAMLLYLLPDGMRKSSLRLNAACIVYVLLAITAVLFPFMEGKLSPAQCAEPTLLLVLLPAIVVVILYNIYRKHIASDRK